MDKFEIQKLTIKNFRGIAEMEIENLSEDNFIFGKNGTNKSTVLQALRLLLDRGYKNSYSFEIEDFHNGNSSDKIELEIQVFYPSAEAGRNQWIDFIEKKHFKIVVDMYGDFALEPQLFESLNAVNWIKTQSRDWGWLRGINLIWISPNYDIEESKTNLLREYRNKNRMDLNSDIDRFQKELKHVVSQYLKSDDYPTLQTLQNKFENDDIIKNDEFNLKMGLMDLKFNLTKQVILSYESNNGVVNQIGDGLSRINSINIDIKTGKLKNDSEIYILLFEEVENNLHITQQRKLLKNLKEGILKGKTISFITTHSPNMIFFNSGSTFIKLSNHGKSIVKIDPEDEIISPTTSPFININIAESLFYDKVYIVEGSTEMEFYDLMFRNNKQFRDIIIEEEIYFLVANGAFGYIINDFLKKLSINSLCKIDNDLNSKNEQFRLKTLLKRYNIQSDNGDLDSLEENSIIMSSLNSSFEGELLELFNEIGISVDDERLRKYKVKYLRDLFEVEENIKKLKEINVNDYFNNDKNKIFKFLDLFK